MRVTAMLIFGGPQSKSVMSNNHSVAIRRDIQDRHKKINNVMSFI